MNDAEIAELRAGLSDADRLMATAKALCLVSSVTYSGAALDDLRRLLASAAARLDAAEGGSRISATFEVHQDGTPVALASGPRDRAYAEAMHYAAVYGQDGPVEVFEHVPVAIAKAGG